LAISLQRRVTLAQNFRQKGSPATNHFFTDSQANECLETAEIYRVCRERCAFLPADRRRRLKLGV